MLCGYGLNSFHDSMRKLIEQARGGDEIRRRLVSLPLFTQLRRSINSMVENGAMVHPKLSKTIGLLREHFERAERVGKQTSAIVFVNYRIYKNLFLITLNYSLPSITIVPLQGF